MNPDRLIALTLDGATLNAAEIERMSAGLRLWVLDGGKVPLERWMGLPSTPRRLRLAARNGFLLRAASMFEGSTWAKARRLHDELTAFRLRRWPCWSSHREPPTHASTLDALLWHAFRAASGAVPRTPEALFGLLSKHSDEAA